MGETGFLEVGALGDRVPRGTQNVTDGSGRVVDPRHSSAAGTDTDGGAQDLGCDGAHHGGAIPFKDVGDSERGGLAGAGRPEDEHRLALFGCHETPT
ncbi:MAG: hypothetical protein QGD91_11990, partial [Actinomycetota bacterium]|nr:hypothetical protein [Actinomycetota bacterium]